MDADLHAEQRGLERWLPVNRAPQGPGWLAAFKLLGAVWARLRFHDVPCTLRCDGRKFGSAIRSVGSSRSGSGSGSAQHPVFSFVVANGVYSSPTQRFAYHDGVEYRVPRNLYRPVLRVGDEERVLSPVMPNASPAEIDSAADGIFSAMQDMNLFTLTPLIK